MRYLVIGALGQLGSDLVPRLAGDVVPLGHPDVEITDPLSVSAALDAARPDVVVNCAAYNLVDQAEDEPDRAYSVNALGPRNLARACAARDTTLVHVSTDYVFGLDAGHTEPYRETDTPGPVSAYGLSKLAGEYFVRALCPRHFVVRTCGLYGRSATKAKGNFVETMLRLGRERGRVRVVDDQRCTPTFTADLAAALVALLETTQYGLYHATNAGSATWCGFAREIFRRAGMNVTVAAIPSADFGAKARRPAQSVLNCERLQSVTGCRLRPWPEALGDYLGAS
jgi:dTDP-4-dehydrorhamnose reductase